MVYRESAAGYLRTALVAKTSWVSVSLNLHLALAVFAIGCFLGDGDT